MVVAMTEAYNAYFRGDGIPDFIKQASNRLPPPPPPPPQRACQDFTHDLWFQCLVYGVIIINAVQLGVEVDVEAANEKTDAAATVFATLEVIAAAIFIFEMCAKLYFSRVDYFRDRYNLLDFTIVILSIIDVALLIGDSKVDLSQFSVLRIIRLTRLLRIVRLIQAFKEMTLILTGIVKAFRTMTWVVLLLPIILYTLSIPCVQMLGAKDTGFRPYSKDESDIQLLEVMKEFNNFVYFGNMPRAMYTLFNIAILAETREITRPLLEKMPTMSFFILVFVVFMSFGIMNVIIGVIVESTLHSAGSMESKIVLDDIRERVEQMKDFFETVKAYDIDGDGIISIEELECMFQRPDVKAFFDQLELPSWFTASDLLTIMDQGGEGIVTCQQFTFRFFSLLDRDEFHSMCEDRCTLNSIRQLCEQFLTLLPSAKDFLQQKGKEGSHADTCNENDATPPASTELVSLLDSMAPEDLGKPSGQEVRRSRSRILQTTGSTEDHAIWPELQAFLGRIDHHLSTATAQGGCDERLQQIEDRLWTLEEDVRSLTGELPAHPSWHVNI